MSFFENENINWILYLQLILFQVEQLHSTGTSLLYDPQISSDGKYSEYFYSE